MQDHKKEQERAELSELYGTSPTICEEASTAGISNNTSSECSFTDISRKIYQVDYFNLDMIIAIGYRVNSRRTTPFRIWATAVLKEYIIKGFALNDERMKSGRNMTYFDELQERIRENTFDYTERRQKYLWKEMPLNDILDLAEARDNGRK